MKNFLNTSLGRLRLVGIVEGISYVGLLICSVIKRVFAMPEIIKVPGMIHGALTVIFILALIDAHIAYKWNWKRSLFLLVASLLPFGSFWADHKILKPLAEKS